MPTEAKSLRSGVEPGQLPFEEAPLGVRVHELERSFLGGAGVFEPIEPTQLYVGSIKAVGRRKAARWSVLGQ